MEKTVKQILTQPFKTVKTKAKDAKLAHKRKFFETLPATKATPCTSFLASRSYNKIIEEGKPKHKAQSGR